MIYETNGNRKVTIVVHSMGGPVSLYFLTGIVSQEWKDTYIHSYVTLAGAWSGGNEFLATLVSGPITNRDKLVLRNFEILPVPFPVIIYCYPVLLLGMTLSSLSHPHKIILQMTIDSYLLMLDTLKDTPSSLRLTC